MLDDPCLRADAMRHAELCEFLSKMAEAIRSADKFLGRRDIFDVSLGAHASDRNAVLDPALHLIENEPGLGTGANSLFNGIVVIAEFCIRVGSVRPNEGGIQELGTNGFEPTEPWLRQP